MTNISSRFYLIFKKIMLPVFLAGIFLFTGGGSVLKADAAISKSTIQGIRGFVMIGPSCPVISKDNEGNCRDKPYQKTLVVQEEYGLKEVARFSSNEQGKFIVNTLPGNYIISPLPGSPSYPICRGFAKVDAGVFVDIVVSCDTGIR